MIYLTLLIFIQEGKEEIFNEFETLALALLDDHNGKLLYRIRPIEESIISNAEEIPHEIHFLSFTSEEDFMNYGKDERRLNFMHLKEKSIRSTFLVKGNKI